MPEITQFREKMKDKKRIVIKIGSSSLQHAQTGDLDYTKLDVLVRELCDIRNRGKDVVLVTSGAVAVGRKAVMRQGIDQDDPTAVKQACAAIGQARLMMTYQKIFAEYNQVAAQILMTKNTIIDNLNRFNARNTFAELFKLGVVPIVNENDTVATYELGIGDNDTLSGIVAALIGYGVNSYHDGKVFNVAVIVILLILLVTVHRLVSLALFPARLASKLPVVSFVDKLLGILFGLFEVVLLLWTLYAFLMIMDIGGIRQTILECTRESALLTWLYDHNYLARGISACLDKVRFIPLLEGFPL